MRQVICVGVLSVALQPTVVRGADDGDVDVAVVDLPEPVLTISTDRPSFSDGTAFVPVGHFQLETGYTFTWDEEKDTEVSRHNGPEVLARVPILENFEFRVSWSGYAWTRIESGNTESHADGWLDPSVGVKFLVSEQKDWVPRIALSALTTLPTDDEDVSSGDWDPTFKFIWSYDLGSGLTLGGNLNLALPTGSDGRFAQGQWSMYLAATVAEGVGIFAEYYGIGPNTEGTDAAHSVDVGAAFLIGPRMQFDIRIGTGLNEEAPDFFVGAGLSFLF